MLTHLIRDTLDTSPSAEDEGVVVGEDVDGVDTLGLELVVLLCVWREVVRVARRLQIAVCECKRGCRSGLISYREGSGDGEDDDLLALEGVRGELRRCAR